MKKYNTSHPEVNCLHLTGDGMHLVMGERLMLVKSHDVSINSALLC